MTSTPVRVRVREPFRAQMPDGGYRPGYNVQLATAGSEMGGPRTIVGVRVTNIGSDMGSVTPMLADIEARTAQLPTKLLADDQSRQARLHHGRYATGRRGPHRCPQTRAERVHARRRPRDRSLA